MKVINALYETIGLNIRNLRQAKNITQQVLADSVDLTRTSLVHIEKGQQRLTIERLYKISNILNVSIEKILPPRYKDGDGITDDYVEQESKPFNLLKCGFTYNNNDYFVNQNKNITNEITHLDGNNYSIYCYEFVQGQYNFPEKEDILHIPNINIPNHRFGVELLQSLRVIE